MGSRFLCCSRLEEQPEPSGDEIQSTLEREFKRRVGTVADGEPVICPRSEACCDVNSAAVTRRCYSNQQVDIIEVFTTPSGTSGDGMLGANPNPESRSFVARKSKEVDINRSAHGIEERQSGTVYLDAAK